LVKPNLFIFNFLKNMLKTNNMNRGVSTLTILLVVLVLLGTFVIGSFLIRRSQSSEKSFPIPSLEAPQQ